MGSKVAILRFLFTFGSSFQLIVLFASFSRGVRFLKAPLGLSEAVIQATTA